MRSVGIVCECNPLHGGHEYLIRSAREAGADAVICVMSGRFVQRGEAAVAPPHVRAEALLCGGADAVLELPFPYAAASAEHFAAAGVEILDRLGVGELWFGSECGDLARLSHLSEIADGDDFLSRYASAAQGSAGTAASYLELLCSLAGEGAALSSNDILGLAYLRALRRRRSTMRAVTVRRVGSAYREDVLSGECYPSATALRRLWREAGLAAVLPHLSEAVAEVYRRADAPLADLKHAERLILGHFRLTDPAELETVAALGGGLGNRLSDAARRAETLEELFALAATKKYPNARIRRGVLFALAGIREEDLRAPIAYVRLLAANERGCRFLAQRRREQEIPIVTRRADLPHTEAAQREAEWERRTHALYALCLPTVSGERDLWTTGAIIKK